MDPPTISSTGPPAIAVGEPPALQFHPESMLSPDGLELLGNFLRARVPA